ncbi:hypothetical protein FisN_17Hu205 [Fistulifera solaris]|uniref:Uncharacterized protein n=1 Tax=Fistulifera solaris TaxID=1519565 RepID=A0A1Z5JGY2_FISSO|nr:hypothetical protein FisN_17Hu205 [Fistulifera solaris]|eukprot:GAX13267.1 hypothetical protein FisN_17Hu205 [Fistulifera solaris]
MLTSDCHSRFASLEDAIARGTIYDLIEYIHPARTKGKRTEKKDELTVKHFAEARSATRQNECSDRENKDKLLKICARTLRAINLARAFRFWEKFDIQVVAIRNLQLPQSINHDHCSIYLEADQVSAWDTFTLPTSLRYPWNPRVIQVSNLSYSISFNKYVETNRKTAIRIMAKPVAVNIATCLGTVEILESDLSAFKVGCDYADYTRMTSTIIGEAFYVDFRVSRKATPDERRKKDEALKYIREGVHSIQSFNNDLDESKGAKLSVDIHFDAEKHFTLLHAAIALYDVPVFQSVLAAGADPFLKTPFCSPFTMAHQKVEHLAGAIGELQQLRKSQIEQMITLMREIAAKRTACQSLTDGHLEEGELVSEHIPSPLLPDSNLPCVLDQIGLSHGPQNDAVTPISKSSSLLQDAEPEVGHITDCLPEGDSLSTRGQVNVNACEEASIDPATPILSVSAWLELRVQDPQWCTEFESSQSCQRHDRCCFIHRYRSLGEHLSRILEKSQAHPVPDHDVDCFEILEERSSTGQLCYTSGYSSCTKHENKRIYYAEGGKNGVRSPQNLWWYPTKADAMLAIYRTLAACDWIAVRGNEAIVGHRQTRVAIEPLADSWTNVGKREKGRCRHWPRCVRGEQKCIFFHGYGPFDEPDDKAKKRQSEREDSVYDIRCIPRKDVIEGCLYFTARYRRKYDKGLRYVRNYNGEGLYDNKNQVVWFESDEKVREAIAAISL